MFPTLLVKIMKLFLFAVLLLCCCSVCMVHGATTKFPDSLRNTVTACHINDPEVSQCLVRATDQIKPLLIKGIPELGVTSIDPLYISEITLEQGTSAINIKAKLTNIKLTGLRNYKFSKFDFDVPNLQWFCKIRIAPIELEGDYTVDGKILLAPIQGSGKFFVNVDVVDVDGYQKCKLVDRKGVEYLQPVLTNTSTAITGTKVKLDGLFGGNTELGDITNKVITENLDVLFEDLKPVIDQVITKIFEDTLLKNMESKIPFKELYPEK